MFLAWTLTLAQFVSESCLDILSWLELQRLCLRFMNRLRTVGWRHLHACHDTLVFVALQSGSNPFLSMNVDAIFFMSRSFFVLLKCTFVSVDISQESKFSVRSHPPLVTLLCHSSSGDGVMRTELLGSVLLVQLVRGVLLELYLLSTPDIREECWWEPLRSIRPKHLQCWQVFRFLIRLVVPGLRPCFSPL